MAVDLGGLIVGAAITAALGTIGFLAKRFVSHDPERERAALLSSYTSIAATLKDKGLTIEEVKTIGATIQTRRRKNDVLTPHKTAMLSPYWTQAAMNGRAAGAALTAEAQMQSAIMELTPLLSGEELEALEKAQNAWKAYKDLQVDFAGVSFEGGSIQPLIRSTELESLTLQRLVSLKATIKERREMQDE